MKAIRGATTVEFDSSEMIRESVIKLLNEICEKNSLKSDDIICILFSSTDDLHSLYPAKAAREGGFFSCALYSSVEPDIVGALKKCIRVMVLADIEYAPIHVYLNDAKVLRKDLTKKLNIAIDGPAGSGKSTISKILAKKFDILYLDTGAMYRACALACRKAGANYANEENVKGVIENADIKVVYKDGSQITLLDGENVSEIIRTPEISMLASKVSTYECVRLKMVELQRKIATENSCVLDGRDIGTNVLPDAEFKFFLTASPEIRAKRRESENTIKGIFQPFNDVLKDIILRDEQDRTRRIAPLKKADDAVEINTDNMNVDEVVGLIIKIIQEKI